MIVKYRHRNLFFSHLYLLLSLPLYILLSLPLYIYTYSFLSLILPGEAENLLILKKENLTRLITLLGNRPMLFGSSRKRFLGAILKRTAISNPLGDSAGVDLDIAGVSKIKGQYAEKERAVSMEQLDWATAATTAAAVIGESEKLSSSSHTHTQ